MSEGTRLLTTDPDRLTVLLRDARADANLMEARWDEARKRNAELEAELRATLKWASRMGYRDLEARLTKLLQVGK